MHVNPADRSTGETAAASGFCLNIRLHSKKLYCGFLCWTESHLILRELRVSYLSKWDLASPSRMQVKRLPQVRTEW